MLEQLRKRTKAERKLIGEAMNVGLAMTPGRERTRPLQQGSTKGKISFMGSYTTQPIPINLREQMVQRMQSAPDEDLLFAYEVMLMAEKDRVWKQIQAEGTAEAAAGLHDNLPDLIRQYRMRNRPSA